MKTRPGTADAQTALYVSLHLHNISVAGRLEEALFLFSAFVLYIRNRLCRCFLPLSSFSLALSLSPAGCMRVRVQSTLIDQTDASVCPPDAAFLFPPKHDDSPDLRWTPLCLCANSNEHNRFGFTRVSARAKTELLSEKRRESLIGEIRRSGTAICACRSHAWKICLFK